jgi:hypothetical protein
MFLALGFTHIRVRGKAVKPHEARSFQTQGVLLADGPDPRAVFSDPNLSA